MDNSQKQILFLTVLMLVLNVIAACHAQDKPVVPHASHKAKVTITVEAAPIQLFDCVSLTNPTGGKTQVCTAVTSRS